MNSTLLSMCRAQSIPYPAVFGATFTNISAVPVLNYTASAPAIYNYNHPDMVARNVNFCNVTVTYTHAGDGDSVSVEAWLPLEGWNERLQASGGGGLIAGRFYLSYWDMDGAISQGYAATTTDAGLYGISSWDPWSLRSPRNPNLEALRDFGSVSLNEQAIIGKALVSSFYGKPPVYSYFSGCSQGGRQGLMLAQRYPDAYDGIAASAPANNWDEFIMNIFYPTLIMQLRDEFPPACEFDALRAAAVAFCDPLDGVTDGVVSTLYDCPFDPMSVVGQEIQCATFGNTTRQISETAALAANATWQGARSSNGSFLWYGVNYDADLSGDITNSGYALDTTSCTSNGTCTSAASILVTGWITEWIVANPDFDLGNITHEEYDDLFHLGKQMYDSLYSANDPDLTAFQKAGGKMLTYHGLADSIIPPGGSERYYNQVTTLSPDVHDFYRLFQSPGLGHCSGGIGGLPTYTWQALVDWVENGKAPDSLPVSFNGSDGTQYERNLCVFPRKQVYLGNGSDPTLASSFGMAAQIPALRSSLVEVSSAQWASLLAATIILYASSRTTYNLFFHPLAKYPGPRFAAISNVWYAYNWLTGRWPWKIEDALKCYGDVVRIAPNELVFITPQAARDIYLAHDRMMEAFVKTDFEDLGEGDGGISFETDPVKHREVAKRMAPAFSMKNFKAKEATLQYYIDLYIDKMKEVGGSEKGAEMRRWADWLSMDIAADMTYNRQMNEIKDMKNSIFLDAAIKVNLFGTITQIAKRFPLLSPLMYLFIPPSVWLTLPRVMKINSQEVQKRIDRRGQTNHLDYFEHIVPADQPAPTDKKQITHLEQIAGQLLVASWEPVSNQFYSVIYHLLQNQDSYQLLVKEIRDTFRSYENITPDSVANLKFLHACLHETFRLHQNTADGLPRMSPGAVVDGTYIPKGVICQSSYFAAARSSRYFADALEYRPERWLSPEHPAYETKFQNDDPKAFLPFNQGPRACPGSAIAGATTKLFVAKVLWSFDLVAAPNQNISFDKHFTFYSMWDKPEFWVRFIGVR